MANMNCVDLLPLRCRATRRHRTHEDPMASVIEFSNRLLHSFTGQLIPFFLYCLAKCFFDGSPRIQLPVNFFPKIFFDHYGPRYPAKSESSCKQPTSYLVIVDRHQVGHSHLLSSGGGQSELPLSAPQRSNESILS